MYANEKFLICKGFLSSMFEHVILQLTSLNAKTATLFTFQSLLSGMSDLVLLEVISSYAREFTPHAEFRVFEF